MKPAWDELMALYKDSQTSLIADVDCTAEGQPLCQKYGVQGYPSIKWGENMDKLKDYQGGRDFKSLKSFAESSLGPQCGIENLDVCTDKERELYEEMLKLPVAELEAKTKDIRTKYEFEMPIMKNVARHYRKLEREEKAKERKEKREKEKKEAQERAALQEKKDAESAEKRRIKEKEREEKEEKEAAEEAKKEAKEKKGDKKKKEEL